MTLSAKHLRQLERTIKAMQDLVAKAKNPVLSKANASAVRTRRTGKELVTFRKTLIAERKHGASVAELAEKYGVSTAYIYQLPTPAAPSKTKVKKTKSATPKKSAKKKASKPATTSVDNEQALAA